MKKWIVRISMVFALALMLSVTAFAADGIQTPNVTGANVTIKPNGTDKVDVSYTAAETGKEYLVIVTEGAGKDVVPTAANIVYIDQKTAADGKADFSVYPSALKNATYSVRISSNAASGIQELTEVGTFANTVSYTLGDVNQDENQLLAADVNKDGRVRANDATKILRVAAGLDQSFD